ncbi:MAG: alpha/beta hydrolase [Holophagales bacterium]|nr:MAG: alpha/beta hydrolase [Holophagales bacterium]
MSHLTRHAGTVLAALALLAAPALAGSGQSGNFTIDLRSGTYVEISTIASPQTAGMAFPVTFTVKDGGVTVGWNGSLVIDAPPSRSPGQVRVVNGVGTKQVVLDTPGANVVLSASGGGLEGTSNPFAVEVGSLNCPLAWLDALVLDGVGAPVAGAEAHLDSGMACVTGASGKCRLGLVAPGEREAWAVVAGLEVDRHLVTSTCNPGNTLVFEAPGSECSNPTGLVPVLLVPGIMGSTAGCASSLVPRLPERDARPGDWCRTESDSSFGGLFDLLGQPGWRHLADRLHDADPGYVLGCTVFPVPYDWRMEAPEAAATYLAPVIEEALARSGQSRVHIVAHSMGGLVARAYIRHPDFPQPSDIDKLAMVGAPNHGAAVAYALWEGGDPVLGDAIGETLSGAGFFMGQLDFYRRASHALFETHRGETAAAALPKDRWEYGADRVGYRRSMRQLFRWHVPALRQLLPAPEVDFLYPPTSAPRGIETTANANLVLDDLNQNLGRLVGPGDPDPNRVRSKVFASIEEPTLKSLRVFEEAPNSALELWQDGTPRLSLAPVNPGTQVWLTLSPGDYEKDWGDGTVRGVSAYLPPPVGWAPESRGAHSGLVGAFADEIVQYLTGIARPPKPGRTPEAIVPRLALHLSGRTQPLLTSPGGQRLGIEPGSVALFEEIAGGSVELAADSSGLDVDTPADGSWAVALGGAYPGEFSVALGYEDDTVSASNSWLGYFDGTTPFTFGFSVDSASPERIAVNLAPPPPAGLQADYLAGLTQLSWGASPDAGVTGYAVYGKLDTDAHLSLLGTSTVTSFATGHGWAAAEGDPVRAYAVAARYADGHEGFLSNVAVNDDRDHDGLSDSEEARRGTGIDDPDSDGDGLLDGVEDGLGTSPLDADSDGDGFTDPVEVQYASNPLDPTSIPGILTVTTAGPGAGNVTSAPVGVDCGADCNETYRFGTEVTLTATPSASSTFTGWSGACTGVDPCQVTMDAARAVTATFALKTYALSVTLSGPGTGTVTSVPTGIDCGTDCTETLVHGSAVTLTATPGPAWRFATWEGACSGHETCTLTMTSPVTVGAVFSWQNFQFDSGFESGALAEWSAVWPQVWTWNPMVSGTSAVLYAVWGTADNDVFVVGDAGTILHYDGNAWSPMVSGTTQYLTSVWGDSGTDVYAVGAAGTILHYNGTAWSAMTSGTIAELLGIWGASATDVFAVGASGTILHYNGTDWSPMTSGSTTFIRSVWGSSGSNVFAPGGYFSGMVLRYNGADWSQSYSGPAMMGVWGSSAGDVFVVGSSFGAVILHFDGSAWTSMPPATSEWLLGIAGSGATDVFAVGGAGTIVHYDGSIWSPMDSGTTESLSGVWTKTGSSAFAVGASGTILRLGP